MIKQAGQSCEFISFVGTIGMAWKGYLSLSMSQFRYSKLPSRTVVQVANNRYSIFGKTSTCRNSDERYQERFIA